MKKVMINSKKPYFVFVGYGIFLRIGPILRNILKKGCKIFIITDELVFNLYGEFLKKNLEKSGFIVFLFILKNEENSKNLDNVGKAYEFLFKFGISREDLIFAFGGGMVCDFSGFVAATYKRGIRLLNFPTTILAQVDSAIGGKNAVNLEFGKNLVGTITSPYLVFCDVFLLKTLSKRDFFSGFAEIVKYSVCFSKSLFRILCEKKIEDFLEEIIFRSIKIKKYVVETDEFEKNVRFKLNFGHTVGHALEKYSEFKMLHGEAVSIGMAYITRCSFKFGFTSFEDFLKLKFILRKFKLPTTTDVSSEDIYKNILADKKIYGTNIKICLIKNLGKSFVFSFPIKKFKEFLKG